ncbi:hypothetical protein LIER_16500 [Lithospermum erythrorhizon]|uniref:Uncharacterized protein n=1 Tax=Lithospermum erythrorhizon TaxID=34254 RepID=A0AAV3QA27_LITER
MFVDTVSSADILYLSTFDKLQLPRSLLQPLHTLLTRFTGHSIHAMGVVTLDFMMGSGTKGKKDKTFRIGTKLEEEHKQRLIGLVREYEDVFAWGPEDMPGIDHAIAVHRLYVDTNISPIKQKKQIFKDKKNLAIMEELQTFLKANAIQELKFPNWIANVMLVKKPNKKWRMCTDFPSLIKACPKDFYPLPYLGWLVDGI